MTTDYAEFFIPLDHGKEETCTLKDESPDWLKEAVRDAHRGTLPNDWVFETCKAAVEAFDNGDLSDEDDVHEFADGQVDVYTKNLFQWAADFCLTDTYTEAEAEAKDCDLDTDDTTRRFTAIQYFAVRYIAEVMFNACKDATNG